MCGARNRGGLRSTIALMALYLHFGDFRDYLLARLDREYTQWNVAPVPDAVPGVLAAVGD